MTVTTVVLHKLAFSISWHGQCSAHGTACAKVQPRGQTTLPGKIKGKLCSFATTIGLKSISLELCLVQWLLPDDVERVKKCPEATLSSRPKFVRRIEIKTQSLCPPMALPKQNKSRNFHPQPWNAWPWKSSRGKFCVWPRSKSWAHLLPILQTITFAVGNVGGGGGKQRKLKIYKDQSWPYLSHLFSSFRTFTIVALTSSRTESS